MGFFIRFLESFEQCLICMQTQYSGCGQQMLFTSLHLFHILKSAQDYNPIPYLRQYYQQRTTGVMPVRLVLRAKQWRSVICLLN